MADGLAATHLLVVGTYRDVEVRSASQLHRRMAALTRRGRCLVLEGLGRAAVGTLLQRTTGSEPADAVVQRVHQLTEGNPLFVEQVGRLLLAQGGPEGDADRVSLPEEVYAAIRRRLQPVPDSTHKVLAVSAVLGKEFDLDLVSAVADISPGAVFDTLSHAADMGIVEERSLGCWRFAHGLLREALYQEIHPSERLEWHRRAALALRGLHEQEPDEHVAELAHHFFQAARAGDASEAVRYCSMAGDAAMAVLAFEEAAMQYSRALEALARSRSFDELQRFEILTALGHAERRAGRFPQARDVYRQALKTARNIGAPELLARAAIGYAGLPESTADETRTSIVEEAVAALPEEESPLKARLLLAGATTIDYQAGRERSRRALAMARRVGDPVTLREALLQWHLLNQGIDLTDERLAAAEELIELAAEAGDRERLAVARQWRAYDLFEACEIRKARAEIDLARREAEELRLPFLIWGATFIQAAIALLGGQFENAERLADEALAAGERSEFADVEGVRLWQLFSIRRHQGRLDEMLEVARRGSEWGRRLWPGTDRLMLMSALAELGRVDEAREHLAAVADQLIDGYPGWLPLAAHTCWVIGDPQWAEGIYERLAPFAGRHAVVGVANASMGSCDLYLGQMAALLQRYTDAEAHFEAAHALHHRMGAPAWLAVGHADHARMLLRRGSTRDRERAVDLLRMAEERYRNLGMRVHAARTAEQAGAIVRPSTQTVPEHATFVLEGEYWAVDYGGTQIRLRDSKGLRYLARLLASPNHEVHALDLVAGAATPTREGEGLARVVGGDAGAVLDAPAKAAYRRRLSDIEAEIDDAQTNHDRGRAERAEQEKEFLVAELTAALGLRGRDRKAASDSERARQNASRAIKVAIERITDAHPALGTHLRATVRTGTYCTYGPDPRTPITWQT